MRTVRNDLFDPSVGFSRGRPKHVEALWYGCKVLFFMSPLPWPMRLKSRLLRAFGATIGEGLVIRPRVNIHMPWRLTLGDHCWIGEKCEILNLVAVRLDDHVALAHDVYIAAAGHDVSSPTMQYKNLPVRVEQGSWIATRAFLGPGVTVGANCVVAAGSVVVKDVAAGTVVGGNPARRIGERVLRD